MASRTEFTPQQSAAIFTRGVSIALSAGAGCGKTFVLTQRFLAGLDPVAAGETAAELHQFVAITFTERAAREMRDRIRSACHDRLQNCDVTDVEHWLGVLRGLDSARISTIHSFCTSLLRTQAVEAGLDPRFTVLETALSDTLLRHVSRETLHQLIEQADDDAVQFVVQFGLERSEELLRKLTRQRFQIEFSQFTEISPTELARRWLETWQSVFVPKLIAKFRESPAVTHTLAVITDSPSFSSVIIERIATLSSLLAPALPWKDHQAILAEIIEAARITGKGVAKSWTTDELQNTVKLAFEKLRTEAKKTIEHLQYHEADVLGAAELACRGVRLTQRTAAQYSAAKQAQGVLDFDDLLLYARNLLRDNEHVRERVAAGIRLLMVDEFQDTDPVQADVVRSLCGAAITHGKLFMVGDRKQSIYRFRRADPTVFATMSDELPITGRLPLNVNFRSQPAVLSFVNHLFSPAIKDYEALTPFHHEQQSPIPAIEFLFASFDANTPDAEFTAFSETDLSGESSGDDEGNVKAAQLRRREADWIARRIASMLADPTPRIRSKNKDANGRQLLRRTESGDIVILFRALSSVQDYETALRRYGLDYYLVKGKAFFAQQEIFDLLNLCRYLDDCDDLVGLVGVLRSPFFNLSDDSIQALAFHTDTPQSPPLPPPLNESSASKSVMGSASDSNSTSNSVADSVKKPPATSTSPPPASRATLSLHETLYLEPPHYLPETEQNLIRHAAEILADLRLQKDRLPLSELLTSAIERTGYDAAILAEFLGERKLANLRKLLDMARQFDLSDIFTLKDFVTRLQTSVMEETDEEFATTQAESGDVIRLMSIHQSKGLEFPVVIVADIDRKGPPHGSDAVLHPEWGPLIKPLEKFGNKPENLALKMHKLVENEADADETIRLFYVACTRAADYLILSAGINPDKPAQSPWRQLVEDRFDIRTGLLKVDPLLGASPAGTAGRETVPDLLIHRVPCKAKLAETQSEKRISLEKLPAQVLAAFPAEFPPSARIFPRDFTELNQVSVSRLETIDAELSGLKHPQQAPRTTPNDNSNIARNPDREVDLDMASQLGTIMHGVLERVDLKSPDNWPELLQDFAKQMDNEAYQSVLEQAQTMLSRFFASPLAAELAAARSIYREIDFVLPWPLPQNSPQRTVSASIVHAPQINGIIDLLIETEKGWQILDYKTGNFPQQTPAEKLLAPYELQLGLYARAVEQWFGVMPQELSLITFRPEVRRITLAWSQQRSDQIRVRVDRAIEKIRSSTEARS